MSLGLLTCKQLFLWLCVVCVYRFLIVVYVFYDGRNELTRFLSLHSTIDLYEFVSVLTA